MAKKKKLTEKQCTKNWNDNDIQFPRLLDECLMVLSESQLYNLAAQMDLSVREVGILFMRALAVNRAKLVAQSPWVYPNTPLMDSALVSWFNEDDQQHIFDRGRICGYDRQPTLTDPMQDAN